MWIWYRKINSLKTDILIMWWDIVIIANKCSTNIIWLHVGIQNIVFVVTTWAKWYVINKVPYRRGPN